MQSHEQQGDTQAQVPYSRVHQLHVGRRGHRLVPPPRGQPHGRAAAVRRAAHVCQVRVSGGQHVWVGRGGRLAQGAVQGGACCEAREEQLARRNCKGREGKGRV